MKLKTTILVLLMLTTIASSQVVEGPDGLAMYIVSEPEISPITADVGDDIEIATKIRVVTPGTYLLAAEIYPYGQWGLAITDVDDSMTMAQNTCGDSSETFARSQEFSLQGGKTYLITATVQALTAGDYQGAFSWVTNCHHNDDGTPIDPPTGYNRVLASWGASDKIEISQGPAPTTTTTVSDSDDDDDTTTTVSEATTTIQIREICGGSSCTPAETRCKDGNENMMEECIIDNRGCTIWKESNCIMPDKCTAGYCPSVKDYTTSTIINQAKEHTCNDICGLEGAGEYYSNYSEGQWNTAVEDCNCGGILPPFKSGWLSNITSNLTLMAILLAAVVAIILAETMISNRFFGGNK